MAGLALCRALPFVRGRPVCLSLHHRPLARKGKHGVMAAHRGPRPGLYRTVALSRPVGTTADPQAVEHAVRPPPCYAPARPPPSTPLPCPLSHRIPSDNIFIWVAFRVPDQTGVNLGPRPDHAALRPADPPRSVYSVHVHGPHGKLVTRES